MGSLWAEGNGAHPGFWCFLAWTEASSASSIVPGEGLGRWQAGHPCFVNPALQLYSALIELGEEAYGSSSPNYPHCTLPSQTLHPLPITSPSTLSPDLESRRFKARWMESFFSPVIVVMLRSYSSSLLGEVKTIKAWERQAETLRDIRDWIKDHKLHDFTLEKCMARGELESPSTGGWITGSATFTFYK